MRLRLQLVIVSNAGQEQVQDIAQFEHEDLALETLGLTLAEGKLILKKVQETMVQEQVNDALLRHRCCPDCGDGRPRRGHHDITVRTVFGNVELQSPSALSRINPPALTRFDPPQGPYLPPISLLFDCFRTVLAVKSSRRSRLWRALDCCGPF
jgi:hypothetical protein